MQLLLFISTFLLLTTSTLATTSQIQDTSYFFFGSFQYRGNEPDFPSLTDCCSPYGNIHMKRDVTNCSQIFVFADQWIGNSCQALGLTDSSSILVLPFTQKISFADASKRPALYNSKGISFQVSLAAKRPLYFKSNGMDFNMMMNYRDAVRNGQECSVILFKSASGRIEAFLGIFIVLIGFILL